MGGTEVDTGQAIVNVALGLMREVKDDIERLSQKLDKVSDERRQEAFEQGKIEQRIDTLERYQKHHEGDHVWVRRTMIAALVSSMVAIFGWLFSSVAKWIAANPGVVK